MEHYSVMVEYNRIDITDQTVMAGDKAKEWQADLGPCV